MWRQPIVVAPTYRRHSPRRRGIQHFRRPGERRDPYAVPYRQGHLVRYLSQQSAPVAMGPGVRRDDSWRDDPAL
jgi:hypothetical protein